MELDQTKQIKLVVKLIGGLLLLAWILSSVVIIPTGRVGVVTKFGRVTGRQLGAGMNIKAPWPIEGVWKANTQVQKIQDDVSAASQDLQEVTSTIAVNYHLDPSRVAEVYATLTPDYRNRVIDPAVSEVFKAATAKYTASDLITKRADVKQLADTNLVARLITRGIIVDDISVVNFKFTDEFNKAIEAKQVAQQQAERASYNLDQAKKDAQAQEAQKTSLTQEILTKMFLEKWDGHLPQAYGGQTIFGINLK